MSDYICNSSIFELAKVETDDLIEYLISHQLIERSRECNKCGQEATIKINKDIEFMMILFMIGTLVLIQTSNISGDVLSDLATQKTSPTSQGTC